MARFNMVAFLVSFSIASAFFTLGGCAVRFTYGARPLPLPTESVSEQCYYDKRIELSYGTADYQWEEVTGYYGNFMLVRKHFRKTPGIIFYQGGKKLSIPELMDVLEDDQLRMHYDDKLKYLKKKSRALNGVLYGGMSIALAGCGVMLGGLAFIESTDQDDENHDRNVKIMTGMMVGGAVLAMVGLTMELAVVFTGKAKSSKARYMVYKNLFIEKPLMERLVHDIAEYNIHVAEKCSYSGNADLIPVPADLIPPGAAKPTIADTLKKEAAKPQEEPTDNQENAATSSDSEKCKSNNDCPDLQYCSPWGECRSPCKEDSECPEGMRCSSFGECLPKE